MDPYGAWAWNYEPPRNPTEKTRGSKEPRGFGQGPGISPAEVPHQAGAHGFWVVARGSLEPSLIVELFGYLMILWMEEILHQLVTIGNYKTL